MTTFVFAQKMIGKIFLVANFAAVSFNLLALLFTTKCKYFHTFSKTGNHFSISGISFRISSPSEQSENTTAASKNIFREKRNKGKNFKLTETRLKKTFCPGPQAYASAFKKMIWKNC